MIFTNSEWTFPRCLGTAIVEIFTLFEILRAMDFNLTSTIISIKKVLSLTRDLHMTRDFLTKTVFDCSYFREQGLQQYLFTHISFYSKPDFFQHHQHAPATTSWEGRLCSEFKNFPLHCCIRGCHRSCHRLNFCLLTNIQMQETQETRV